MTDTFNLHYSLLLEPPLNDFEISFKVNKATAEMDEFSRNFSFLEKAIDTWVTGECYLDYGATSDETKIVDGNRRIHIGVTRTYVHKRKDKAILQTE